MTSSKITLDAFLKCRFPDDIFQTDKSKFLRFGSGNLKVTSDLLHIKTTVLKWLHRFYVFMLTNFKTLVESVYYAEFQIYSTSYHEFLLMKLTEPRFHYMFALLEQNIYIIV